MRADADFACCENEVWRPIPDWPHEASTCGRVRSVDRLGGDGVWRLGADLPPQVDKRPGKGYVYFDLRDGTRRRRIPAAVAVLEAHDQLRPGPEYEACHGNDIRDDNHWLNVAWDTRAANQAKMWEQRRLRAMTDGVTELSLEGLVCHNSQVTGGMAAQGRLSQPICHSDRPHGTGSSSSSPDFPSFPIPVQPPSRTLRTSLRSLRDRLAA